MEATMMKAFRRTRFLLLGSLLACAPSVTPFVEDPSVLPGRHPAAGEALFGNFAGRIPCAACDRIKIMLSLFERPEDHAPTTYQLERVGEDGNARITTRGHWTKTVGAPIDPNAVVARLDENSPLPFARYMVVGNNLLLMLDQNDELLVGNGAWSYTLSRVNLGN
jgi:NlpE N-terminal domain